MVSGTAGGREGDYADADRQPARAQAMAEADRNALALGMARAVGLALLHEATQVGDKPWKFDLAAAVRVQFVEESQRNVCATSSTWSICTWCAAGWPWRPATSIPPASRWRRSKSSSRRLPASSPRFPHVRRPARGLAVRCRERLDAARH